MIGASDLSTSLSFEGFETCKNVLELDSKIPVLAPLASS